MAKSSNTGIHALVIFLIGVSGAITFNELGFRVPEILLENLVGNTTKEFDWKMFKKKTVEQQLMWYGGYTHQPRDIPVCGFEEECEGEDWELTIMMCSLVGIILLACIIVKAYRTHIYEQDINSKASVLKFKDLTTKYYLPDGTLSDIIMKKGELNTNTGLRKLPVFFKGNCLMLKKLPKDSVSINWKVLRELKYLRDLNHPNINPFWGVTIVSPDICFLHDYCKKGSLSDIMSKENVQLDWDFKHSFINDIASGILAIHESPIKCHGHLTSKNCLVNHRWAIEVGDFGLSEFRKDTQTETMEMDHERCKDLLWTAPEHLTSPITCSKEGDVYSFGIIVAEIIHQRPPYTEREGMESHEIIHYVRKRCIPPFRPHVPLKIGLDNKLVSLMQSCWNENPEERPKMRHIKPIVKQIRGAKVEIIDNMISMMEKYTNELEQSLIEGNLSLEKERSKNIEFLYKSLPKPIGDVIISGGSHVKPYEVPNQALLIVACHDFTKLGHTPLQCGDILNDFQKLVDNVLFEHQNIYKVYTIREEMMLCSHVQGFRPIAKAQDLLTVALEIAESRAAYPWRHLRNRKLELRMTLHCGSGTGIVVGTRIPTYCVLGKHYELIKILNMNSPPGKIIMTKEFRKQIKLKGDEETKASMELMVCTVSVIYA